MMFLTTYCWNALSKSYIQNETSSEIGAYTDNFSQGESFELLPVSAISCHFFSRERFLAS